MPKRLCARRKPFSESSANPGGRNDFGPVFFIFCQRRCAEMKFRGEFNGKVMDIFAYTDVASHDQRFCNIVFGQLAKIAFLTGLRWCANALVT